MSDIVICKKCGFKGTEKELHLIYSTEDLNMLLACPNCKTDLYLFSVESDEEETDSN